MSGPFVSKGRLHIADPSIVWRASRRVVRWRGMTDAVRTRAGNRDAAAPEALLARARLLAHALDDRFAIPGTSYRVGLDPLLGLVPVVGDVVGALLSAWILVAAARLGAPVSVLARMAVNLGVDAVVGAVPLAGDLFDAGYKANLRNLRLLESWAARPSRTRRKSRVLVAAVVLGALLLGAAVLVGAWKVLAWASSARS